MSQEMVGGCCVCSDERGWSENPLVYCDGQGCSVAVHQACYGIVSVPPGPWYCRKCESQERAARVRCELCPSKDGALKRTDSQGWAHVVCALYIPEVRFGNVTTMEPIILQLIPQERFSRTCYICQEQGKASKSTTGACMQCNKFGCKQQFHVTCAQTLGLLCEEAGHYMDNVKYCGYCQHHYSKLKKGPNVKTVPPYKPVNPVDHDSSPEKDGESSAREASKKKSYLAVKPSNSNVAVKLKTEPPSDEMAMDTSTDDGEVTLKIGTTTSHAADSNKFTTSNFVETVVTQSDPVFGSDSRHGSEGSGRNKKRKGSVSSKSELGGASTSAVATPVSTITTATLPVKNLSAALSNVKGASNNTSKSMPGASGMSTPPVPKGNLTVYGTGTKITIAASREDLKKPKIEPHEVSQSTSDKSSGDAAFTSTSTAEATNAAVPSNSAGDTGAATDHQGKSSRSSSADKSRKPKRMPNKRTPSVHVKDEVESPPGSPEGSRNRKKPIKEEKDNAILQPVSAPHMLGNQLNPNSSMAQKMNDSLHQEVEAHSIYNQNETATPNLVGPPLFNKIRSAHNDKTATLSAANSLLSLGNPAAQPAKSLEYLLERNWEMGGQFLMEQAQHHDIAQLLSFLYKKKNENMKLSEKVNELTQRRDSLLALNARLSVPLALLNTGVPTTQESPPPEIVQRAPPARMENGINHNTEPHPYVQTLHSRAQPQPSPTLRPPMSAVYTNPQARRPVVSSYQSYPSQQMPSVNTPTMGVRRDDHHQQM